MSRSEDDGAVDGRHAVATRKLSKRYDRETALDGVDLRVPEGAAYVLVGANGAGKTTTLRVLMNLERPDAGSAEVFGLRTDRRGPEVRAQVGWVPEHRRNGRPRMTCRRLLRHVATYYPAWDAAYADRLSRAFDVPLHRRVGTLSRGEARRLDLVLALSHRPPLLLLDEPTDGLDPVARNRILETLVRHMADTPTTVLLSTHQIHEVEHLADHVGVLRKGRLVAQMTRDELRRTVRRYRVAVPDGWEAPPGLRAGGARRSSTGREREWTLVGEETEVTERLDSAGARVCEVTPLGLEEAAIALLTGEASR